jgi:hypothetical protein
VPAAPAAIRLAVQVPDWLGRQVRVRHQRVDEAHGNAFVAWQQQGSPASPSAAQRAELLATMDELEREPERTIHVEHGVATLSFELPRFGISLLTLTPSAEPAPAQMSAKGGCSVVRAAAPPRGGAPTPALLALALVGASLGRRGHPAPRSAC